ncbi:sigma-70 family RNA polymerase sigma factor [Streptomyces sp. 5-10]|nr:sigma-70 family RNA polymerase sigma factor [Streptomyces sp. 5-10]
MLRPLPVAEHTEEDRATALAVADGLGSLPPHQRQVLTLRYYADLPVRDMATLLDIPEGTVKSRLHTAVAALRTRLRETEVIHATRPPRKQRCIHGALAAAAAACVAAIVVTVTVTADGDSGTDLDTTGRGQTFPQALACATAVVEGDLTAVRPVGQGRVQVTVSVDQWFKPSTGPGTARFDLADPAVADPAEAYATGDHLLLLVPRRKGQIPDSFQGQELRPIRDRITRTLPEAAHTPCPPEFQ